MDVVIILWHEGPPIEATRSTNSTDGATEGKSARWRVLIGHEEVVKFDQTFPTSPGDGWAQARIELAKQIEPFLTDTCWDCRLDGTAAFNQLAALPYGEPFDVDIDGDGYILTSVQ